MPNTITKNGVSSSTLTGLLISELPDITKPARREEVTEVDGRDGDVVRYKGYDSYTKQAIVGLHGAYDIDAIANFFDGDGDFIFSNEPTKKYRGRIVNAIDFERLVRFRKAKVAIVVEPYKKLVNEADVQSTTSPMSVENKGYVDSLPKIKIEGTAGAIVVVKLSGSTVCTVTIPPEGNITLDGEAQNAYNSNADKNQYVQGDFMRIPKGTKTIAWTVSGGTVSKVTVSPNSRWL